MALNKSACFKSLKFKRTVWILFEKVNQSEKSVSSILEEMDWINCNLCCCQPGDDKERVFFLSSCGHIFCGICLSITESSNVCKVCSTQCQMIQLSAKMKPDTEMFFQEPASLIKKHHNQVIKLLDFQKEHRIRLVSYHRKALMKYRELERKFQEALERVRQLERENSKLKQLVNSSIGVGGENRFVENFSAPPESVQRALSNAGSNRNSPQNRGIPYISPGGCRISPGRLTLMKNKDMSQNSQSSKMFSQVPLSPITSCDNNFSGLRRNLTPTQHELAHRPPEANGYQMQNSGFRTPVLASHSASNEINSRNGGQTSQYNSLQQHPRDMQRFNLQRTPHSYSQYDKFC